MISTSAALFLTVYLSPLAKDSWPSTLNHRAGFMNLAWLNSGCFRSVMAFTSSSERKYFIP